MITKEAFYFEGEQGTERVVRECPAELKDLVDEKYHELLGKFLINDHIYIF